MMPAEAIQTGRPEHATAGSGNLRSSRLGGLVAPCLRAFLVVTLGLTLPACQVTSPHLATTQPAIPTDGNGALAEYIADQPFVTVEPAYRAVYILWKGEVFEGDFHALTEALAAGGIITQRWNYPADGQIDRASVGYMLCRAGNVRSGLNWQLTGLGRYAWRELNYLGIANPISEYGYVPGGQFIGMLARSEEYMLRRGQAGIEPVELGGAP